MRSPRQARCRLARHRRPGSWLRCSRPAGGIIPKVSSPKTTRPRTRSTMQSRASPSENARVSRTCQRTQTLWTLSCHRVDHRRVVVGSPLRNQLIAQDQRAVDGDARPVELADLDRLVGEHGRAPEKQHLAGRAVCPAEDLVADRRHVGSRHGVRKRGSERHRQQLSSAAKTRRSQVRGSPKRAGGALRRSAPL